MTTKIDVKKEVLDWAVEKSGKNLSNIQEKFKDFNDWIQGNKYPTLNQLIEFGKFTNIPFGILVLKSPPIEKIPLLDFRTVDTLDINHPSRELIDTIKDMQRKQDWMRNYLIDAGYDKNRLVNSISYSSNLVEAEIANRIRKKINLKVDWYKDTQNKTDSFSYLKIKLSEAGVLVMQNGTALGNTHRPLDVNEFRAFTILDDYAPLIFINTKDTQSGKVFSLLHELVHIFIGQDSLYNNKFYKINKFANKIEIFCNAIAGEIIVPSIDFINVWESSINFTNIVYHINDIANYFKVSEVIIARKALDNNLINRQLYDKIVDQAKKNASMVVKRSGGNANNTAKSRIDPRFVIALSSSLESGYAVFSDIYKLTGLSRNVFGNVEKRDVASGK